MKSLNKHKHLYINIFIILSFIILSTLEIFAIWPHNILNGNDLYFHLERMEELVKSNTLLPRFSFNSFSNNGSAVMTLYPYLILYPFALLIRLIGHIHAMIYFVYISNVFITLLISYYSSLHLTSKKSIRYIFALIYSLSFEYITLNFWSGDMGMSWSATFMPLALFGFMYWLKNNKWLMLSIGLSLIIYSNVPMTIITLVSLIIWTICNYKLINESHIISLIKGTVLTLLTTAIFWLPACKLLLFNHHFIGTVQVNGPLNPISLVSTIHATLNPKASFLFNSWFPWELTIPSLLGFIIATFRFHHLTSTLKQFYLFSLIILLVTDSGSLWNFNNLTHIGGLIQQPIRAYLLPQVLLTYIFSVYVFKILNKISNNKIMMTTIVACICVLLLQVIYINIFHSQQSTPRSCSHANGIIQTSVFKSSNTNPSKGLDYYLSVNKSNTVNKLTKSKGIINNKNVHIISNNNGNIIFRNKHNLNKLNLPIFSYNKVNYQSYLDKKPIQSYSNNNLLTINHIRKGTHHFKVNVPLDKVDIFSRFLTLLSIITYIILAIPILKRLFISKSKKY